MAFTLASNDCCASWVCVEALCAITSPTKATTPRTATAAMTHPGTPRFLLAERSLSSSISFPPLKYHLPLRKSTPDAKWPLGQVACILLENNGISRRPLSGWVRNPCKLYALWEFAGCEAGVEI